MYRRSNPRLLTEMREAYFLEHPELDPETTSVEFRPDGEGGFRIAGHMAMADRSRYGCGDGGGSHIRSGEDWEAHADEALEIAEQALAAQAEAIEEDGGQVTVSRGEKCSACGTTIVTFDPPLVFNVSKSCGAVRDEAPDMSCDMPAGHEGQHAHLVEKLVRWPTDEMIEAYAAEAEAGYDPEQLRPMAASESCDRCGGTGVVVWDTCCEACREERACDDCGGTGQQPCAE